MTEAFVTGLVLGAGGSQRLGRPKQLLPYRDGTLLGHVVGVARTCSFNQFVVALGGAAEDVREHVDVRGAEVVVNDAYGEGCSSSIAAALRAVDPRCDVLVLMLGDQPGVTTATSVTSLACWSSSRHTPLSPWRSASAPNMLRAKAIGWPRPSS